MRFVSSYYNNIVKYDYITKLHNKTTSIPKFSKIVLSVHSKNDSFINLISSSLALELVSNQKTKYILKKASQNLNIKIKLGVPAGCKVTLRNNNMEDLLLNLFILNEPTYLSSNTFKFNKAQNNHIHFCLNNLSLFGIIENNYYLFRELRSIKVSIITNSIDLQNTLFLLKSFKIIRV